MTYRSVSEALSVVSAVERSWDEMFGALEPMLRKNPPISTAKLQQLLQKLMSRPLSSVVQIGDDLYTGIVRNALGSSRANIVLAKEILVGPNADRHLSVVFSLVDTAKVVIRQLGIMVRATQTLQDWTSSGRSSSMVRINGLGALGLEPLTIAAAVVLVAGVLIFVVGVSVLIDTMQRSQNAEIARRVARETCDRAAESGHPCTPEDFQEYWEQAARVQNEISPPLLQPHGGTDPLSRLGDLVFWGGLLAVGYAIFVTMPSRREHHY